MADKKPDKGRGKLRRKRDPYYDRRSGEDRRKVYWVDYFLQDNPDRRSGKERRSSEERREGCIRINEWASICPDKEELEGDTPYVIDPDDV